MRTKERAKELSKGRHERRKKDQDIRAWLKQERKNEEFARRMRRANLVEIRRKIKKDLPVLSAVISVGKALGIEGA
jgi:hypothetical protein